jgi:hypothetical protein
MSDTPSKVKIYDRPEPKGPSPLVLAIALLIVLIVGFFVYRALVHPAAPRPNTTPGIVRVQAAFWQEAVRHGKQ